MTVKLRMSPGVAVACLCVALGVAAPASAATPSAGWSIESLAEPTNFSVSETQNAVEALKVLATGGTYELQPSHSAVATVPITWDADAREVQQALEALAEVGPGNVSVTGGPGDASGSSPYIVTWIGGLSGGSPGALLVPESHLTDGVNEGTVSVKAVQREKASDRYTVTATNTGSRASEGEVTVVDDLPAGLVPVHAEIDEQRTENGSRECTLGSSVRCTFTEPVPVGGVLKVNIQVALTTSATGVVVNKARVSDGSGHEASASESTAMNAGPAPFGVDQFAFETTGVDGALDPQAGDHPDAQTTTIALNTVFGEVDGHAGPYNAAQEARDIAVELPLGFSGDPLAVAQCPQNDLTDGEGQLASEGRYHTSCPAASRVGTIQLVWAGGTRPEPFPVYNVVPEHGYPAELGFNAGLAQPFYLYASLVPSAAGYRLRVVTPGALRSGFDVEEISLTIFGAPGERDGTGGSAAFITNPAACSGTPLGANLEIDSWEGASASAEATAYPDVTGCNLLQGVAAFDPSIEVQPETTQADAPAGYQVDLRIPQASQVFGALATPPLRNATVALPPGVSISPAAASGPNALEGCTPGQIDLQGMELGAGHPGGNNSPYDDGLMHASPGHCPEGSRIGTVQVKTPVLASPLQGHLFLAQPQCGGASQPECTEAAAEEGKLVGLYLEAEGSGVIVKLPGSVEVGGYGPHSAQTGLAPGQLRTRFQENPQLPFEDLKIALTGGDRASLANPQTCGTAMTSSVLEPWSAPASGPSATPSWAFQVTGCDAGMPFGPSFSAGTVTPSAGGFSPFTLTLGRHDGEQDLSGVTVSIPPGLLGMLSRVQLCGEPQAAQGTCGQNSLIGHTQVAVGSGSQPLWVSGSVYLTGPYKGAPFGLSVVVPAIAGPFNLGNVIVRSAIHVDPHTSALTIATDPLPQFLDGIPLRIKTVNVTVDKPGFVFNPTNCNQSQVTGILTAAQGASVDVASPFAVGGCANLPFKPSFKVSTAAKTSKKNGASLDVRVTSSPGQANIGKVAVSLPKQLPSRLTTIQQACTEAAFAANPSTCPAGSDIGTATAKTPVLSAPLTGPAYLVSHGGAAFPDLVVVLQGEGVTLDLVGSIDIKHGITSSAFNTVPDAPISSFELSLPEGPHSGLAAVVPAKAKGNLCGQSLVMPTTLTGQNGAQIKQSTKIAVNGCPKAKQKKSKPKHKKTKGKKQGR